MRLKYWSSILRKTHAGIFDTMMAEQWRKLMGKRAVMAVAMALTAGCFIITSCGEGTGEKTQGFTQSLEQEQKKADEALETLEQASEALDRAAEQKEQGERQ